MKLGFIAAADRENNFNKIEPLGLLYMAAYLEKYLNFENVIIAEDVETLIGEKPDIVGISTYSTCIGRAGEIAKKVKEEICVPVIIGGPHVTLYPEYLPEHCDIGVIGEGERTMAELLELYLKEHAFEPHELRKIKGIIFKEGSEIVQTPERELIFPLDIIPPPKRELVHDSFFVPNLMTGRGCPYKCSFCATQLVWKKYRNFSPEYVSKELLTLIDNDNFNKIEFGDDLFAISNDRVKAIHDIIINNELHKKAFFYVNIRANIFNEEMACLFKEMNVTKVFVGFESGSDKILKFYNKKQTVKDNQKVVDLCHKYDIGIISSFIAGAPVETEDDIKATHDFIYRNSEKIAVFVVCYLQPCPGTPLWNSMKLPPVRSEKDLLEITGRKNFSEYLSDEQLEYYLNEINSIYKGPVKHLSHGLDLICELHKKGLYSVPDHQSLNDLMTFRARGNDIVSRES